MKEVKQKEHMKKPRVLDEAAKIPRSARNALTEARENSAPADDRYESAQDYALQQTEDAGRQTVDTTVQGSRRVIRKATDKMRDAYTRKAQTRTEPETARTPPACNASVSNSDPTYQGGKQYATRQTQSAYTQRSVRTARYHEAPKTAVKNTVSQVKQSTKGAAKTYKATVKTADRTVKTARKSAETAEKSSQASIKAAKTAAQTAKRTAQATAEAAKTSSKAIADAVKYIIAAIRKLIAVIAAGGWVVVLVIIIVAAAAAILCSAFGVFFSNDTAEGQPMTELIQAIDTEFQSEIDANIAALSTGTYDEIRIIYSGDGDGDSAAVNNWNDVLSVYAVLTTTKADDPMDVVVLTPKNEAILREVFSIMNTVEYSSAVTTEEVIIDGDVGGDDAEHDFKTVLTIRVELTALDCYEGAEHYAFTHYQMEILEEMMSPMYYSLFAALIGVDVYGGADMTGIISGLPVYSKGADVVRAAVTRIGAPYVLGAKGDRRFDCSGLAYWAINQVDPALGNRLYTNAAGQAKYCYDRDLVVGQGELQPGDLVFWQNLGCAGCHRWQEIHHVGIYIGDGKVIEASSSKGRVVIRDLWSSANYPLYMFARPY